MRVINIEFNNLHPSLEQPLLTWKYHHPCPSPISGHYPSLLLNNSREHYYGEKEKLKRNQHVHMPFIKVFFFFFL